ncbi:hypothetical protein R5R35_003238 [Gryllus longicercus]|uniref:CHK kinase-like domain-containing protein n=1 Tax=Gryllus longicercus TaxID=2509291 RepID=A0AAN9Z8G7_9ORTH
MAEEGSSVKLIEDFILPKILQELQGATILQHELRAMDGMKDNWASTMFEIKLDVQRKVKEPLHAILKVMNEDKNVREKMKSHKQFFNEIHFYSTAMSLFTSVVAAEELKFTFDRLFPKCFCSYYNVNKKPENYEDAYIVMENLKVRGFKLGNRTSLDFKHCSLALQCLGEFHALSYFIKERVPDRFINEVVKPIHETNYDPSDRKTWNDMFGACEQRIIDACDSESVRNRLRELATREPFDVFTELVQPQEPLAVLCHGDFLRNNVLFRYENGEPVEMKFIDFQTIRYASPTIDISLLLCMNTTHELRVAHWDELLQVYHNSLTNTLSSLLRKPKDHLDSRYSFDSFMADFRRHAVYGYLIAIEFQLWMFAEESELEAFVKMYWEERGSPRHLEALRHLGGVQATRELVMLAKDLVEKKCI